MAEEKTQGIVTASQVILEEVRILKKQQEETSKWMRVIHEDMAKNACERHQDYKKLHHKSDYIMDLIYNSRSEVRLCIAMSALNFIMLSIMLAAKVI